MSARYRIGVGSPEFPLETLDAPGKEFAIRITALAEGMFRRLEACASDYKRAQDG